MKWASAISEHPDAGEALRVVSKAVRDEIGPGDIHLVLVFVSPHHEEEYAAISRGLQLQFPGARILGCSAGGLVGGGLEVEHSAGISLTAARLPDVGIHPFHLAPGQLPDPEEPEAWHERLDLDPDYGADFLLLPDPFTADGERLLGGLDRAYSRSTKLGGLASGASEAGRVGLFVDDRLERAGTVGLALYGDIRLDSVVAQGCRSFGKPLTVTRCEGHMAFELDNRPAIQALEASLDELGRYERVLFGQAPLVGVAPDGDSGQLRPGDYLCRNLIGVDRSSGGLAGGVQFSEGQVIQFQLRDARTSEEDLREMLERYTRGGHTAAGALMFSCLGRGRLLYGIANHDTRIFEELIGDIPLGGFFCNGEIGPVRGRTFLHGYTSAFALARPRGWD